jgi:hypothetical protein
MTGFSNLEAGSRGKCASITLPSADHIPCDRSPSLPPLLSLPAELLELVVLHFATRLPLRPPPTQHSGWNRTRKVRSRQPLFVEEDIALVSFLMISFPLRVLIQLVVPPYTPIRVLCLDNVGPCILTTSLKMFTRCQLNVSKTSTAKHPPNVLPMLQGC